MLPSVTTAVVLAGGMGTRLRSAVPVLPKPLAPIRGRPFLAHQMDYWIDQGIERFVLSVGYKKELIMDHFGPSYNGATIEYAVEETPLGTGGGLVLAARGFREPALVLNGDTYFEVSLKELVRFHSEHESVWTFSLFRTNDTDRYMGMEVTPNGEILSLKSDHLASVELANGGVYIIDPSVLDNAKLKSGKKVSLEEDLVADFMGGGGKLYGLECSGIFIDIGVPEDYFRAADVLPNRQEL